MQLLARQRMICNGLAQVQFEEEWPRLQAQTATATVLESLFAPKLATLRGLVEQVVLGQQRKAVVFSQWRNMLRLSEWAVRDQPKMCASEKPSVISQCRFDRARGAAGWQLRRAVLPADAA